ncbi:hypothetical protein JXB22_10135 [candidate division WOR-3 bacterium]|nr:hypothetical protein [candidate division WOR-3 bacterium]
MFTLSCLFLITLSITGASHEAIISLPDGHITMDVIPEIEVLAPRYMEGQIDSLSIVQGITVFGLKEDDTVRKYNTYRRSFLALSSLFGEYAVYLIVGILTVTIGAVALTKLKKGYHIHLAHQPKHNRIHEYYVWRKAFLEKEQQKKLTRRT